MKSLHEVVVRNRLEHLRQRQRSEALQAQEELLAGVASAAAASFGKIPSIVDTETVAPPLIEEETESYTSAMEFPLIDITKLPAEERQIDILTQKEALRTLVSC